MSFLWPSQSRSVSLTDVGVRRRGSGGGGHRVSSAKAMRVSAVWAAIRLRADMISSLPVDVLKRYPGISMAIEVKKPAVLESPDEWTDGQPMTIADWLYATQSDLDSYGNTFGIITKVDGAGLPREIHLVDAGEVTVKGKGSRVTGYTVMGKPYEPSKIWHERQYVSSGSPVGLSPVAHAALALSGNLSATEFALEWFDRGATPSTILKNQAQVLDAEQASRIKRRISASMRNGEPAVVGKDWEITIAAARAKDAAFLELMDHGTVEIARFFSVPADLIDAAVSGQSVTYANLTQRNLQFLIMNLGPAIKRREDALKRVVGAGAFVKLNTEALLRMDPKERRELLIKEVAGGVKTVNEARELENMPPVAEPESAISTSEGES